VDEREDDPAITKTRESVGDLSGIAQCQLKAVAH
jgi:hypothetical protein